MNKLKRNMKALVLSMGLGTALFFAPSVQAQGVLGDLLDNYYDEQEESRGALLGKGGGESGYSVSTEQFGNGTSGTYNIGTELFGQDAPLGSGLFIMAAAGAAYALKKRKMNK